MYWMLEFDFTVREELTHTYNVAVFLNGKRLRGKPFPFVTQNPFEMMDGARAMAAAIEFEGMVKLRDDYKVIQGPMTVAGFQPGTIFYDSRRNN